MPTFIVVDQQLNALQTFVGASQQNVNKAVELVKSHQNASK